jgi:hypothetical protein
MKNSYEDIINLPHHRSTTHPNMARANRAAQFSPFAALTGHDAAIREQARLTDKRVELDEYIKADLNERLCFIRKYIKDKPEVSLVFFQEDNLKDGGRYITATGVVKKIDVYEKIVVMEDGRVISINNIVEIDCELFSTLGYI